MNERRDEQNISMMKKASPFGQFFMFDQFFHFNLNNLLIREGFCKMNMIINISLFIICIIYTMMILIIIIIIIITTLQYMYVIIL